MSSSKKNEPDPKIVEAIEELLRLAKDGKIQTFAAIGLGSDETCITSICFRRGHNIFSMIGALNVLADSYKKRVEATL